MTIEEYLNLPEDAFEAIGKMNNEELAEYLKDIILVEPKFIPPEATPCISAEDKEEEELMGATSGDNPIKLNRKKKKGGGFSKAEEEDILSGL